MASTYDGTTRSARLTAVDALRGLVMVVMALDHARDFVHAGAMAFAPEDLTRTTPILFLTRWVTHICAPTFMFLAGVGAFLRFERDSSIGRLTTFLWTRGLWLIVIELTVMRLAMNFSFSMGTPVLLIVLTALGLSMMVLALLARLPDPLLLIVCLAVIVLHNTLDSVQASRFGAYAGLWNLLHQPGAVMLAGLVIIVAYPLVPWFAVMGGGFAFGPVTVMEPARRQRLTRNLGLLLVALFVVIRAVDFYGDPAPWSRQASTAMTDSFFPQDDEVSAVAAVPAHDAGAGAVTAGQVRSRSRCLATSAPRHRTRAVLLLRRPLLDDSRGRCGHVLVSLRA